MSSFKPVSNQTTLELIVGFAIAEEVYYTLDYREQLILDLLMLGYSHSQIGWVLGLSQGWITMLVKRIRLQLAESKLRQILETRQHIREEFESQGDKRAFPDNSYGRHGEDHSKAGV